jgi:hypothetical protein
MNFPAGTEIMTVPSVERVWVSIEDESLGAEDKLHAIVAIARKIVIKDT